MEQLKTVISNATPNFHPNKTDVIAPKAWIAQGWKRTNPSGKAPKTLSKRGGKFYPLYSSAQAGTGLEGWRAASYWPSLLSLSSAMVSLMPFPFGSEMNGLLPCRERLGEVS